MDKGIGKKTDKEVNSDWIDINIADLLPDYEERVLLIGQNTIGTHGGGSALCKPFVMLGCRQYTDKGGEVFISEKGKKYRPKSSNGLEIVTYWMHIPKMPEEIILKEES